MLLVDDDEPELGHRCEHRRARAEHDARLRRCRRRARPRGARASVSAECSTASGAAKRSRKRPTQLRREADLGHQHQRALARREHALHEPQVHLGLAAAGDPVQHEGGERAERRADGGDRSALLGQELQGPACASRRAADGVGDGHLGARHEAARSQRARRLAPGTGVRVQEGDVRPRLSGEQLEQGALPGRAARLAARGGLGACGGHDPALLAREGGRAEPQRSRQGTRQYLPEGVVVVLRRPFDQGKGGGIEQRARVEYLENRLQARARNLRARTRSHDDSDRAAAAKRHAHPRTGWDFLSPRSGLRQVVEQAPQGGVERHPENLAQWRVQQGVKSVTYAAYHASTGCAGARYTGHV